MDCTVNIYNIFAAGDEILGYVLSQGIELIINIRVMRTESCGTTVINEDMSFENFCIHGSNAENEKKAMEPGCCDRATSSCPE